MRNASNMENIVARQSSSNSWQGIVKAKGVLEKGACRLVRDGKDTDFWLDVWIEDCTLRNLLISDISLVDLYRKVLNY